MVLYGLLETWQSGRMHRFRKPAYRKVSEVRILPSPPAKTALGFCYVWPHRLTVRTSAFQAGNRGSIPLGVMDAKRQLTAGFLRA